MNIYHDAILAQDAVNLSGLVRSWAQMQETIWEEARAKGQGTAYVNTHPVNILMACKVQDLSLAGVPGLNSDDAYAAAYTLCRVRAEKT